MLIKRYLNSAKRQLSFNSIINKSNFCNFLAILGRVLAKRVRFYRVDYLTTQICQFSKRGDFKIYSRAAEEDIVLDLVLNCCISSTT